MEKYMQKGKVVLSTLVRVFPLATKEFIYLHFNNLLITKISPMFVNPDKQTK